MSLTLSSPRIGLVAAFVALTALVLGGGALVVVLPQMSRASSFQRQIAVAEARLAAAADSSVSTNATSDAASQLFQLGAAMPETTDMPGILIQLSALAAQSSITIASIEPSALVLGTSGYSTLPITLVVNGKYASITDFLALVRQAVVHSSAGLAVHGRLFIVNEIQLAPSTSGSGSSPGGASATGSSTAAAADSLGATLQIDAFVYGTTPPATTSTSTTTTAE